MDSDALTTLLDLLKKPSPRPSSTSKGPAKEATENQSSPQVEENSPNKPTIFDLQSQDRYRILGLIEELLDSQEEVDKLKQDLNDQKQEFREKKSALIKKLDLLGEKHEKALADIQHLKERHSETLEDLQKKITTVSQKFEASISEIDKLRRENAVLRQENLEFRRLNNETTASIEAYKQENSKLKMKLRESRHKEKSYKHELKQMSETGMRILSHEKSDSGLSIPRLSDLNIGSSVVDGKVSRFLSACPRSGAGDFAAPPQTGIPSSLGITTIKAPGKVDSEISEQKNSSSLCVPGKLQSENVQQQDSQQIFSGGSLNDSLDSAILENLFFRF